MASDPFTGSGAYVSGSGGVEASRFTGNCGIIIFMLFCHKSSDIQIIVSKEFVTDLVMLQEESQILSPVREHILRNQWKSTQLRMPQSTFHKRLICNLHRYFQFLVISKY